MITLGINPGGHDNSACLIEDGKILAFAEMDRITRKKYGTTEKKSDWGMEMYWPIPTHQGVANIFRQTGLTLDDVDAIAIGWNNIVIGWTDEHLGETDVRYSMGDHIPTSDPRFDPEAYAEVVLPKALFPRKKMPPIHFVPHHVSHAASGYLISGFENASILVVDGRGDKEATSLFHGIGSEIHLLSSTDHSLGALYDEGSMYAGFGVRSPGKLMGLAPYGNTKAESFNFVELTEDNYVLRHILEGKSLTEGIYSKIEERPFTPDRWNEKAVLEYADFAASVQGLFEDIMKHLVATVREKTGCEQLVISGGCGQNCTFNGLVASVGRARNVYVPPVPHDAGVSLGAALYVERLTHARLGQMNHAYFGYEPEKSEIDNAIAISNLPFVKMPLDELVDTVSQRLVDGKIVGWYQGRAEIGPRALGARSLLMDPRKKEHWEKMNKVKGRESWRPLAPSVLKEHAFEFFREIDSPLGNFMVGAFQVKEESREKIPACVHIDGSARPQFVDKETNPRYYALISAFSEKTGVPVLMNTSFNLSDEPIVHLPSDAILSFMRSDIDALVIDDYFLEKESNEAK